MTRFVATNVLKRLAPVAALLLAACSADVDLAPPDVFMPVTPWDRHPIEVARGTMKLRLATNASSLSAAQQSALLRFSGEARGAATGAVVISRPSASRNGDAIAHQTAYLLSQQGIAGPALRYATYRGGRYDPVVVSYTRTFATVAECGDWSRSLTITGLNEPYNNFGCSQQHNIAALVANPEDIVTPRGQTPPDAMRRQQVFTDYRTPKDPATPYEDDKTTTVSDVAQ